MTSIPADGHPIFEPELARGPGPQLRRARETLNWSVADVASKLRLDAKLVAALEEDDFSKLPGPAFVRGYLRSYARLMELPPEPVVQAFEEQGIAPPQVHLTPPVGRQARATDKGWRLVTYAVVIGLAGLVALWWKNQDSLNFWSDGQPVGADQASAPLIPPAEMPQTPGPQAAGGMLQAQPAPSDAASAASEPQTDLVEAAPPADIELPGPMESTSSLEVPPATVPAPAASAPEPAGPAALTTGAQAVPSVPPSTGVATLVLRFSEDSWVAVEDATGKRLAYEVVKAGGTKTLQGQPPLRVRLGYAPGVSVEYNGAHFDVAPYTNRRTARFVVGGPS